ncbi:unnamed protein product [Rotaria sp. Silwood2]|nr:unnamed protein product [Rotaria sp. Silwood2]CAF2463182.1 unnamed protein product [Rotaria sp. Silwood2]CAF2699285.1 unnamed protein product [Rotaria sp. Silwood2]CAF2853113.1 unnamed protein product [Rotaria sp. Silwood2]CAF3916675.1 unnamed protein product [Rotaria sp. Silwood2]
MPSWCTERNSNIRCEGCEQLYCLPCMNTHHKELIIQFELLFGIQNELKESFNIVESNWQNKKEFSCLFEIDQWEQEIINRIRQIAENARTTVNDMMIKNMSDIRQRIDQLTFDMQQRQQEGNYLDNDIIEIRNQLEQLNNSIKNINEKIRINYTGTNKVDWNSLINVTADKKLTEKKLIVNRFNFSEFYPEEKTTHEKIWQNLRKFIKNKHTNNDFRTQQSNFKRNTSLLFEPIVLTACEASTCSVSKRNPCTNAIKPMSDNFRRKSLSDNKIMNSIIFTSGNHDPILPQASDA